MNWQYIVNNFELIYASTLEDKVFQNWTLKKTTCNILFYESYPINDIDKIICSIIDSYDGTIEEEIIATILGFNVVNNFDITPKRYADKAEFDIFRALVKPVFDWGLVVKSEGTKYILTELGYRALSLGEKYIFFTAKKILFENFKIKPIDSYDNVFFPYYSALGLFSDVTDKISIPYNKIDISAIFNIEVIDLITRHSLQSKSNCNIYKSEITNYFQIVSSNVDIRIYKQGDEYYPIIFYSNKISVEATELLYKPENIDLKLKKIEWGLYFKLIKDPDAILDFKAIIPFEDMVEIDSLICDTRLVWGDQQLFTFIADRANANQWYVISNQCTIDVIKVYIEEYFQQWDWTSLSLRIDNEFLIETATKYPWNFEAISTKGDVSIEVIKTLLLLPELKEQEWDWDSIMPQLDFDFIKTNISRIDFELSVLTKTNTKDVLPLIAQFPDKNWNWSYISDEFDLSFILDNILNFSKFLNLKNVINRAFTSEYYGILFCTSNNFKSLLIESKETTLRDYSPNIEKYVWNAELINLLERTNYLTWGSGYYTIGFECNPHIEWSYDYFKRNHTKVATEKGHSFVSQKITLTNIVLDFPEFSWNWDAISSNTNLINDKQFVLLVANKLNIGLLLHNINSEILEELFKKSYFLKFLENNPECWLPATKKSTIEFVRRHIDYNWNWPILTTRFCSSIKIEALGNPKWINKWDWKYLTINLDISKIINNLDLFVDYWDWEYLTKTLDKSFVINNLTKYNINWNWSIVLHDRLDISDLLFKSILLEIATCISVLEEELQINLWQIITRKFSYTVLEDHISTTHENQFFHWDFAYFYGLSDFNLRSYLQNFSEYVNWKELSGCKKLVETFRYDDKLFSEHVWRNDVIQQLDRYKWDFQSLSKIGSICCDYVILNRYKEKWDWDYLTLYCSYFSSLNIDNRKIWSFQKFLNFKLLSQRDNAGLNENIISEYIDKEWDWKIISSNKSIHFSKDFILENKEKEWDWNIISIRNDIEFDNKSLIELSEKQLNWDAISSRNDIVFSEKLITQLSNKPLNWEVISKNKSFVPNLTTLSMLKGELLDWDAISNNENLSADCLWDYKDRMNWRSITKNKIFNISDSELILKYQEYIDWKFISNSMEFKLTFNNLIRFKLFLNWSTINARKDFHITNEILEPFQDVLDWSYVSKSRDIAITAAFIEKYRNKLDWSLLRKNPQVIELLDTTLSSYTNEFNCADFVEKFHDQPYIYHFTHLFNAIEIIKSRKILSRHKAEGKFANAAGNLVDRRNTAHDFARFYFRTQTPTQFYNECLGIDSNLKNYQKARNLGLPKCPMPVFFKFNLNEVVRKMSDKCYYSTGNMQSNWAKVEKVSENPNAINTKYLYSNVSDFENYKQYSQQEFLIEEEFNFSELDLFEIICYDEEQANILKAQLTNDPICKNIHSNSCNIYHRNNRKLNINETDTEISISSEYSDNAFFSIKGEGLNDIKILDSKYIKKETATEIIAYPSIRFTKTDMPIAVYFVDLENGTRDWLVYKNAPIVNSLNSFNANSPNSIINHFCKKNTKLVKLYNSQVRHYTIRKHTELVICQFQEYFNDIILPISHNTFLKFLAIHDIGKPIAEIKGNRNLQHHYTQEIIITHWDCFNFNSNEKELILALSSTDCIGEYFQDKQKVADVIDILRQLADETNLTIRDMFYLFMVYYQSDVAAYTEDAGGLRFLENLFEYNGNKKAFNTKEGLIQFSPTYWSKYLILKEQL